MSGGSIIRMAREAEGLTQAQLAKRLGITQPSVARLEKAGDNVTLATLQRALNVMNRTLEIRSALMPSSVDDTQILEALRLTPGERIERLDRDVRRRARRSRTRSRPQVARARVALSSTSAPLLRRLDAAASSSSWSAASPRSRMDRRSSRTTSTSCSRPTTRTCERLGPALVGPQRHAARRARRRPVRAGRPCAAARCGVLCLDNRRGPAGRHGPARRLEGLRPAAGRLDRGDRRAALRCGSPASTT